MYRSIKRVVLPICSLAMLSGCGANVFTDENLNIFGTKTVIENTAFQTVDLALILQPNFDFDNPPVATEIKPSGRYLLESAFRKFNTSYTTHSITGIRHRNIIQQRIVAASNQRCGEYKKFLKAIDSRTNLILGSLTTAFAGAGAIFTGADTVRALSGIAGIISGGRAEFNQGYFSNRTIQVLTNAFHQRRESIQDSMLRKGKLNLIDYPVERAIGDAVRYHENCSLIAGLEVAALAVQRVNNPGARELVQFQGIAGNLALGSDILLAKREQSKIAGKIGALKAAIEIAAEKLASAKNKLDEAAIAAAGKAKGSLEEVAKGKAEKAHDEALKKLKELNSELEKEVLRLAAKKANTESLENTIKIKEIKNPAPTIRLIEDDAIEQKELDALKNGNKEGNNNAKDDGNDKKKKIDGKAGNGKGDAKPKPAKVGKVQAMPLPAPAKK